MHPKVGMTASNPDDRGAAPQPKSDEGREGGAFAERLFNILLPQVSKGVNPVGDWATLATLAGEVRSENQDRIIAGAFRDLDGRKFHIAAVSDGMGGLRNGDQAASLTIAAFVFAMVNTRGDVAERLTHATLLADRSVFRKFAGKSGATLSAIYVGEEGETAAVNVGDSRIYAYDSKIGRLSQVSVDDTLAGLAEMGAQVDDKHNKGALLQYIGMGSDLEPNVFPDAIFDTDDAVLLMSDGIHWVGHSFLELITRNATDPVQLARRLIQLAEMTGSQDNASVAIVRKGKFVSNSVDDLHKSIDIEIWTPNQHVIIILDSKTIPAAEVAKIPRENLSRGVGGYRKPYRRKGGRRPQKRETEEVAAPGDSIEREELTFEFEEPKRVEDETSG